MEKTEKTNDEDEHLVRSSVTDWETRFSFIDNENLRINTALAFQYITFLIAVKDKEEAEGTTVGSSINKNLIIYTASIVEGCLHYCLKKYIELGKTTNEKLFKKELKHTKTQKVFPDSDGFFCASIGQEIQPEYREDLQFIELNRLCKKCNILTETLFDQSEALRIDRNNIHLSNIGAIEKVYRKKDVQEAFTTASKIIGRIEGLLK